MYAYSFETEDFVDNVKFYTANGKNGVISNDFEEVGQIIFTADDKYVNFEFISDGSVQFSGFDLRFQEIGMP
uniref:Uncharacterized protein n=1 Tax=Panagrolaimus sp. ES5 TaxID=591445 RepID=A0AC34GCC1_9BILA